MNANDDLKKLWPYGLAFAAVFLLLPLTSFAIKATGWTDTMILGINPLACVIISYIYAIKNEFDWMYVLVAPVIFLISIGIYYSSSAVIYVLFYAGFSLTGAALGKWRHDVKKRNELMNRKIRH